MGALADKCAVGQALTAQGGHLGHADGGAVGKHDNRFGDGLVGCFKGLQLEGRQRRVVVAPHPTLEARVACLEPSAGQHAAQDELEVVEHAAAIVAQVDDDTLELAAGMELLHLVIPRLPCLLHAQGKKLCDGIFLAEQLLQILVNDIGREIETVEIEVGNILLEEGILHGNAKVTRIRGMGIGLLIVQDLVARAAKRSREIGTQVVRGILRSLIVVALLLARPTGTGRNESTREMVLHLSHEMAIVQGCQSLIEQFAEFVVSDVVTFVEGLVLRQELVIDGIPVNPLATFIVPDTIVLVEGFP